VIVEDMKNMAMDSMSVSKSTCFLRIAKNEMKNQMPLKISTVFLKKKNKKNKIQHFDIINENV